MDPPALVPEHVRQHSREIVDMYRGLVPSDKISRGTLAAMAIGLLERWLTPDAAAPPAHPPAVEDVRALYSELLYQVATKHPGETRHETARRYISEHENHCGKGGPASAGRQEGQ